MVKKVTNKFKTNAPFGIATKRFAPIGFHPDLDPSGSLKVDKNKLGPGQYDPKFFECCYKKVGTTASSWKRKVAIEEFSNNLGFRNAHILRERQFRRSCGGPGSYEISEQIYNKAPVSSLNNVGFGSQKRFWNPIKDNSPPPGSYGKNTAETSTLCHKQITPVPPFEWDGFVTRFKSPCPPWAKAPNRYDPKDHGNIDAVLAKFVSKRGPYDLFTGPRDETTIKNHFGPPTFKGPKNWFHTWPNELETLLNHPDKRRCGKFLRADRFTKKPTVRHMLTDISMCYKDPDDPGPAHYTIKNDNDNVIQSLHPFNSSLLEPRPGEKWRILPGVGRYYPKYSTCECSKRETCVFKSKTGRTEYKAVAYNSF